ncbi:SDR family oxidoreductase [Nocardia jejuensis]|uniref:SDR family oxidoreductase n=1 Tax=Nocardia jejuensis TaxID=328049 RepID=UPI00082ECA1C|nr:SDR family oxidoreductase [Nocardia jejuensis]
MSRVVIIGGHGKIALRLARLLSAEGHEVSSLFRNPEHAEEVASTGAVPVVADIENLSAEKIAELVSGHDAVVFSAGAGGGNPDRTYAVDRDAAERSADGAAAAGVRRFVLVSYFGARTDHGVPPDNSFFHYAEAKAAADAHVRASDLDWTIVAPSTLTLDPGTGRIETAAQGATSGTVSRDDVAAVIAAVLAQPATIHRTIQFNNGPTPIDEAITA